MSQLKLYKVIEHYADLAEKSMKEVLLKKRKLGTGKLVNSIAYRITMPNTNMFKIKFTYNDYGEFINSGTKKSTKNPSPEMVESVGKWLGRKKISIGRGRTRKLKPTKRGQSQSSTKSAAYAVSKSILAHDHPAVPFLQEAKFCDETKNPMFKSALMAAIKQDIADAMSKSMKKNKK